VSLTSFSASLDGSLKDVELRGSLAPPGDDAERGTSDEEEPGNRHRPATMQSEGRAMRRSRAIGTTRQSGSANVGLMTDSSRIDFEALYRGQAPGQGLPPVASPPWDTKTPKESVVAWQAEGLIRGDVLDIGCGFGDNAVFLAGHGHRVTGVDIAPTALITARRRAHDAGLSEDSVTFAVGDATDLTGYLEAFDTVVDSGMYHCLDADERARYAAAAYRAARPGASLLVCCFSEADSAGPRWRRPGVSEPSLRDTLGEAGWAVVSVRPFTVPRDDGVVMSFWLVHADRAEPNG
jgi:SAM-dependent methyltransferase